MKVSDSQDFQVNFGIVGTLLSRIAIFIKCGSTYRRSIQGVMRTLVPWEKFSLTVAERVGHKARKMRSYWLTCFLGEDGSYHMGGKDPRGSKNIMFLDRITAIEREARRLLRLPADAREAELEKLSRSRDRYLPDAGAVRRELKNLQGRKFINVPDRFRDLLSEEEVDKGEVIFSAAELGSIMPKLVVVSDLLTNYDQIALAPQVLELLRKGTVENNEGVSGLAVPHPCGEGELEFASGSDGLPVDVDFSLMDLSSIESMLLTADPRVVRKISLAFWQMAAATGVVPADMLPKADRIAFAGRTYFDVTDLMSATMAQGHEGFLLVHVDKRDNLILNQGAASVLDLSTTPDREKADITLQAAEAEALQEHRERLDEERKRKSRDRVESVVLPKTQPKPMVEEAVNKTVDAIIPSETDETEPAEAEGQAV